mgnify:CR=1 FL=1
MMNSIREEIERLSELCLPHENGPFLVIRKADVLAILDRYEVVADETIEDKVEQWARLQDKMRPWVFHRADHIIILREKGDQR